MVINTPAGKSRFKFGGVADFLNTQPVAGWKAILQQKSSFDSTRGRTRAMHVKR
jgi:hypothetical protein